MVRSIFFDGDSHVPHFRSSLHFFRFHRLRSVCVRALASADPGRVPGPAVQQPGAVDGRAGRAAGPAVQRGHGAEESLLQRLEEGGDEDRGRGQEDRLSQGETAVSGLCGLAGAT